MRRRFAFSAIHAACAHFHSELYDAPFVIYAMRDGARSFAARRLKSSSPPVAPSSHAQACPPMPVGHAMAPAFLAARCRRAMPLLGWLLLIAG